MVLMHAATANTAATPVTSVVVDDVSVPFVEGSLLQRAFFVVRTCDGARVAYASPQAYFGPRVEALRARARGARARDYARDWHEDSSDDDTGDTPEAQTLATTRATVETVAHAWSARRGAALAQWTALHADELARFAREEAGPTLVR